MAIDVRSPIRKAVRDEELDFEIDADGRLRRIVRAEPKEQRA